MSVKDVLDAVMHGRADDALALVAANPSLAVEPGEGGSNAIQIACYFGNRDLGLKMAEFAPEIDLPTACSVGLIVRVRELLMADPSIADQLSVDGLLPFCFAAAFGYPQIVRDLIFAGASVNARSRSVGGVAPLHSAVFGGNLDCIRQIVEAGADVNAKQEGDFTPLHGAAQSGLSDAVRLLIEQGANKEAVSAEGKTAIDYANEKGHKEIVEFLSTL